MFRRNIIVLVGFALVIIATNLLADSEQELRKHKARIRKEMSRWESLNGIKDVGLVEKKLGFPRASYGTDTSMIYFYNRIPESMKGLAKETGSGQYKSIASNGDSKGVVVFRSLSISELKEKAKSQFYRQIQEMFEVPNIEQVVEAFERSSILIGKKADLSVAERSVVCYQLDGSGNREHKVKCNSCGKSWYSDKKPPSFKWLYKDKDPVECHHSSLKHFPPERFYAIEKRVAVAQRRRDMRIKALDRGGVPTEYEKVAVVLPNWDDTNLLDYPKNKVAWRPECSWQYCKCWRKLSKGMSESDVKKIVGNPQMDDVSFDIIKFYYFDEDSSINSVEDIDSDEKKAPDYAGELILKRKSEDKFCLISWREPDWPKVFNSVESGEFGD